ncbi:MAG TPA: hypothetical protein V6D08_09135 [Candidatus Obscuribacterales bacterium]
MANTGADVSLIKSALNHLDVKTTLNVYVHTVSDAERKACERGHKFILSDKGTKSKFRLLEP